MISWSQPHQAHNVQSTPSTNTLNSSTVEIALLGNPNAGKTTLFNLLTGSNQRTGNWPGVTVERKEGAFELQGQFYQVVDLPGTYSLDFSDTSEDERVARDFVQTHPQTFYLNIVDASTLERGLYLTLQLRELNVPLLVLLNMMDVAERRGIHIDIEALQKRLGCPVIPISLRSPNAVAQLQNIISQYNQNTSDVEHSTFKIQYPASIEKALIQLEPHYVQRSEAVIALQSTQLAEIQPLRLQIEQESGEEVDLLIADTRFNVATQWAKAVTAESTKVTRTTSDKVDKWVLGTWTGIPIFLIIMYLLFSFSINLGGVFIDFFELSAQALFIDLPKSILSVIHAPVWLSTLVAEGLGGGIQVVATFIPIIAALYLVLTMLEESGYMARAAFVMDQFMRKLGVSGKAFVPLIVGFGCNVPAIMAARTLDSPRERILTVLMTPFMSCGARLAVYALFAAAFFSTGGQNIVFLLYLSGIAFAILTALIMRKTVLQGKADHFVMEMPTYQIPQWRNVLINTWNKLKGFILEAGQLIVLVVMVINVVNSIGTDGSFGNENSEKSVLSATAKVITPVFAPMGIQQDNWPATVGILSGLLAKEVVVGTLDALYSQESPNLNSAPSSNPIVDDLKAAFASIPDNLGKLSTLLTDPLGTAAVNQDLSEVKSSTFAAMNQHFDGKIGAFAYLLFILMYFPCVASTGAMYREVGRRWTLLGIAWSTGLAYGVAVLFYQLATFSRHPIQSFSWVIGISLVFAVVVYMLYRAGQDKYSNSTLGHLNI
ncbi:MAG: Fe(2+) transporter permease subunit FeoB [Pseudomonadota bacterium]|jgi:ferrous iron transport protein B